MSHPGNHENADTIDRIGHLAGAARGLEADVDHLQRLATVGTLAAGMAHEVNNILTPALAYLQMANANPDDPNLTAKAIAKALAGIESTTHIVQALLGFSVDAEEPSRACVRDVVAGAIDCLGRDPSKDGVAVIVSVAPEAVVGMRPHGLQQVVLNLVLNACTAMQGRPGNVTIAATDDGQGSTVITVTDSGPGIPEEVAGRLFEPFVSSRPGRGGDAASGGSGLGLAVCRHLVEQAHGSIDVASTPGRGTTFQITLPTIRADRAKAG